MLKTYIVSAQSQNDAIEKAIEQIPLNKATVKVLVAKQMKKYSNVYKIKLKLKNRVRWG